MWTTTTTEAKKPMKSLVSLSKYATQIRNAIEFL